MNEQLAKNYEFSNDILGYPQLYKGIKFYPVQVKDMKYFNLFNQYFCHAKNAINDINIVKMSYLRFVCSVYEDPLVPKKDIEEFIKHISKANHVEIYIVEKDNTQPISPENSNMGIIIDDIVMDENEFDELREIILEQNGLSIEWVNQFNARLEESLAIARKNSFITFEDMIYTIAAIMGKSISEIGEWTFLQLKNINERLLNYEEFKIYRPMVDAESLKKLKNFVYHAEKQGRYAEIQISMDEFVANNKGIIGNPVIEGK
jgi:hypothetical protein